jgi:hypothetical protein
MQEEVENRSVTLIISSTKLTARVLRAAISKYLVHRKDKKIAKARAGSVVPHGKQTVKQLVGQNAGVSNLEITDSNIKSFDRVARKYGVDYAVKKDRSASPPKYLVFFKARDADALTAAFTEFTAKTMDRAKRPSVLSRLRQFKELVKANTIDEHKNEKAVPDESAISVRCIVCRQVRTGVAAGRRRGRFKKAPAPDGRPHRRVFLTAAQLPSG